MNDEALILLRKMLDLLEEVADWDLLNVAEQREADALISQAERALDEF